MKDDEQIDAVEEITFLDIAVILAESWRVLVAVPIIFALIVGLGAALLPRPYETSATVRIGSTGKPDIRSEATLNAVAEKSGLLQSSGGDRNAARKRLLDDLRIAAVGNKGELEISYLNQSAEQSRAVMDLLLAEFSTQLAAPAGTTPDEQRMADLRFSIGVLEQTVGALQTRMKSAEGLTDDQDRNERLVHSLVAVVNDLQDRKDALVNLESLTKSEIVEPPSAPQKITDNSPARLAGLAATLSFIVAVGSVFVRAAIKRAGKDPRSSEKLKRIAGAFQGLSRKKKV